MHAIGDGNYELENPFSADDSLGNSLYTMGLRLKKAGEEEKVTSWQINGLNELSTILRSQSNMEKMYSMVISFLTRYMKASQGGLFIINRHDPKNVVFEIIACYAYDRMKSLSKQVAVTDGLLGECVAEMNMLYLEKVPPNYIHITSGLGLATPTSLVLFPMKHNEEAVGVAYQ